MPEICRFQGIIIKMFGREHNPPHLHAFQGKYEAMFNIETGELIEGDFPTNKRILSALSSLNLWVGRRKTPGVE